MGASKRNSLALRSAYFVAEREIFDLNDELKRYLEFLKMEFVSSLMEEVGTMD